MNVHGAAVHVERGAGARGRMAVKHTLLQSHSAVTSHADLATQSERLQEHRRRAGCHR